MIGLQQFTIDGSEFIKGMSTSDDIQNGGYSPSTLASNPLVQPGVMYGAPYMYNKTLNNTNGNHIMSCGDATYLGAQKFTGTDTGYFYSFDGNGTYTQRQAAVAGTFTQGYSDMVQYTYGGNAYVFVTTTTNIVRMTGSTLTALDATWWTVTLGMAALGTNPIGGTGGIVSPHPMLVFEDSLWIGDFNKIHKWDGTTASYSFLTLSQDQLIVALAIDPSTGKMLITTTQGANASDTVPKINKVLIWDGTSQKPVRSVVVDDMVTAMQPMGGIVYMIYGINLGYWTGSGIEFLRKLKNAVYDLNSLPYKHQITYARNTLYVADGPSILAYGEILPGEKKFYYAAYSQYASNGYMTAIFNFGTIGSSGTTTNSPSIGCCFFSSATNGKDVSIFNPTYKTVVQDSCTFMSNNYEFKHRIQVKEVIVEFADPVAAAGIGCLLYLLDNNGTSAAMVMTNNKTSSVYELIANPAMRIPASTIIQFQIQLKDAIGIRRLIVSYDTVN